MRTCSCALLACVCVYNRLKLSLQSVRVFFRTNRQTCTEWLSRIRAAVIIVALNAGRPEVAVRHSYKLLQELKDNNNTQVTSHVCFVLNQAMVMCYTVQVTAWQALFL